MNPADVTIKISMTPEGAKISEGQGAIATGKAPAPVPPEELEAMAGMEMGKAPAPVPPEELEAMAAEKSGGPKGRRRKKK